MTELLPCPFCGSDAAISEMDDRDERRWWFRSITCNGCGARLDADMNFQAMVSAADASGDLGREAIAAWNRRIHAPASAEATDGEAAVPEVRGVDAQVLVAARQLDMNQKRNPEWLWYEQEAGGVTLGRWAKHPCAAPYIRVDLFIAALNPSPAPVPPAPDGWRVRQLEWNGRGSYQRALSIVGWYSVMLVTGSSEAAWWKGDGPEQVVATLDAAKAAAQRDFDARIRAAIEPAPAEGGA